MANHRLSPYTSPEHGSPALCKRRARLWWCKGVLVGIVGMAASAASFAVDAAGTPSSDARATRPEAGNVQLRPLDITVNRTPVGQWMLLEQDGGLYANPETLKEWRLLIPAGIAPISYRKQPWIALFALPGYRARFDYANQAMELEFAPSAFAGTQLATTAPEPPPLSPTASAVFLNYDISHVMSKSVGFGSAHDTGALTELGLSLAGGTLISSQVGRNLSSSDPSLKADWKRLETTWTRDFRDNRLSLRIGDTSTHGSMWGRSVYFGGFQIGTNYGLTPGFTTQSIPTLSGSAVGPSTVDLYVNNVLRQTANVPAGPFTIENFNQLTGAGTANIVVRDVLGRETVISKSFFSNANLLEAGLSDWSVSTGRQRYNLGLENADYRDAFASGLYRRGIHKELTLEGRADLSSARKTMGLGANAALPFQALFQSAIAMSQDKDAGKGAKLLLGIDQQSLRSGFGVKAIVASPQYRELGFAASELPYKQELSFNVRRSFDDLGSVGMSMAKVGKYDGNHYSVLSLNYALRVGERGSLYFGADRVSGQSSGHTFNIAFVLPLDKKQTLSANTSASKNGTDSYAGVNTPIDQDTGFGWRALGGTKAHQNFAEAGLYFQGDKGFVSADLSSNPVSQVARFNAQGALVAMEGHVFASRRLQESFALVEVKGYPDVGVGFQGTTFSHTDKNGLTLIPRLQPYQINNIRLNANDLPFSAEIDNIEQQATPAWRSGVKVTFPVRSGRGALIKIVLEDGQPAPAGTQVELPGDNKEFFVARRGEAFVTGLQANNSLTLIWKGQRCSLAVALPPGQPDEIPRVGPLTCKGVMR